MSQSPLPKGGVPREAEPEFIVPFAGSREDHTKAIRAFAEVRWGTADLTAENLLSRARAVWWPMWLVDAHVSGPVSLEVGYEVEVESSEEVLDGDRWTSRAIRRVQTEWSPRVGWAERRYDNIALPALNRHDAILTALGGYDSQPAVGFSPDLVDGGFVWPPDRRPEDLAEDAANRLVAAVGTDCAQAVGAASCRGVSFHADYRDVHWTWMLLPVYLSGYTADDGTQHAVWIHGQTGKIFGPRIASVSRSLRTALGIAFLGLSVFLLGALVLAGGLAVPLLLPFGGLIALVGAAIAVFAVWPPLAAWRWNRKERANAELDAVGLEVLRGLR
jgi:hypothetical protein